jgi:hypothetical protein
MLLQCGIAVGDLGGMWLSDEDVLAFPLKSR